MIGDRNGAPSRRNILIGALSLVGLTGFGPAGCAYFDSPGNVAYARRFGSDYFAIDMQRGHKMPLTADDVAVFKVNAPQEWDRIRDTATAQRMADDFNANPGRWSELSSYEEHLLWYTPPEPPL